MSQTCGRLAGDVESNLPFWVDGRVWPRPGRTKQFVNVVLFSNDDFGGDGTLNVPGGPAKQENWPIGLGIALRFAKLVVEKPWTIESDRQSL